MRLSSLLMSIALLAGLASLATAQTVVTLPDSNESTTLTAAVAEQCEITVPVGVTFTVTDIASTTTAPAATVTINNIVLASATKQLKVSIQADAADFTKPAAAEPADTTWAASAVKWVAPVCTNATGAPGTLSDAAFSEVFTATADTATASTNALVFTLDPNTTVKRSGNHTLVITWKVESIGA